MPNNIRRFHITTFGKTIRAGVFQLTDNSIHTTSAKTTAGILRNIFEYAIKHQHLCGQKST